MDFRRGADGALCGWVGFPSAGVNNPLTIRQGGGSAIVALDASDAAGVVSFRINGVELGRVDANGTGLAKITTAATVRSGAGQARLAFVAGTNAGTGKLVAYAGTSATPVTIVDNIGAGF